MRRSAATKLRAHSTKHCSGSAISHDASAASCTSAEQLTCEGAGSGRPGGFQQGRLHGTGDLHPCFDRVHRKHHAMLRDPGERASHHVSANANACSLSERSAEARRAARTHFQNGNPLSSQLSISSSSAMASAVVDAAGRARARAGGGALPHGEGACGRPTPAFAPHIPLAAQAPVLHATTHSSGACFREATLRSEVPPQNSLSPRSAAAMRRRRHVPRSIAPELWHGSTPALLLYCLDQPWRSSIGCK